MTANQVHSPNQMIDHAISLWNVANHLNDDEYQQPDNLLFYGTYLAVPILMALAVEIALKALQCQEGEDKPEHEHDLLKLFEGLEVKTRSRLEEQCPNVLDPISLQLNAQDYCPIGAGILKVLEYHRNTFTNWRYLYESGGLNCCYPPELNQVFKVIVKTFEEKKRKQ